MATVTSAQIRKNQKIQIPISDNLYVSWADFNTLSIKMDAALIGILLWVARESWQAYKKKDDKTIQNLEKLMESVARIEERLKNTPTHSEVHDSIRDEVLYATKLGRE